jgi:hypothetical protein
MLLPALLLLLERPLTKAWAPREEAAAQHQPQYV